jgi:hypothetical protein
VVQVGVIPVVFLYVEALELFDAWD